MKAVILAGGLGSRLRPFTDVIPKPLLPLGDKSIIEIQIGALAKAGVTDVYVATNYLSHIIEAYVGDGSRLGVRVHISREEQPLGTAGPIRLIGTALDEPFIMMNGDIITKLDFKVLHDFAVRQNSCLTVATKIVTTPFRFGNVFVEDDKITGIDEKPDFKVEILAGIYCMKPEIMRFIPEAEYFGMDSLIKRMLGERQPISRYLIKEYWLDIGQVEDYSKARELYNAGGSHE